MHKYAIAFPNNINSANGQRHSTKTILTRELGSVQINRLDGFVDSSGESLYEGDTFTCLQKLEGFKPISKEMVLLYSNTFGGWYIREVLPCSTYINTNMIFFSELISTSNGYSWKDILSRLNYEITNITKKSNAYEEN